MHNTYAVQDSHAMITLGLWPTRLFDGFPYLVTRVVPAMYHIIVLPDELDETELLGIARQQAGLNVLETCLVLSADAAIYIATSGQEYRGKAPRGGEIIVDRLRPCRAFTQTAKLCARRLALARFIEQGPPRTGYMFGDLTKGGRTATFEETIMLAGTHANGVPRGLARCTNCGDWRGRCLDPSPDFAGQLMQVHCRCANDNRCGACEELLHTRKLNANQYNETDGHIWPTPGFSGLSHACGTDSATMPRLGDLS